MACRSSRTRQAGLLLAVVALLAACPQALAQNTTSLISVNGLRLVQTPAGTYALVPDTVIEGTVLKEGSDNLRLTAEGCASTCNAEPTCNGFNWCNQKEGCSLGAGGGPLAAWACQLVRQDTTAAPGQGLQLEMLRDGDESNKLGNAGVKLRTNYTLGDYMVDISNRDSSSGLSAGTIAAIVVASVSLIAVAALAVVVYRVRSRQGGKGGQGMDELVAAFGRGSEKEPPSAMELLVAKLLSETANPQWTDAIIPKRDVKFSTCGGKPVRLGAGASGEVYKGVLHGATPCALKVFKDLEDSAATCKYFIQEASMLRRLAHPYIVQFLGVSVSGSRGLLVMELVSGGDLWKALRADTGLGRQRKLGWYNRGKVIAIQIASAVAYLHASNVAHLDIKPGNILLTKAGDAKLADVGFAKMLKASHISSALDGRVGTFNWAAPEVLLGGKATLAADIFSLGIVLWELCAGEQPLRGLMEPLHVPDHCPAAVADLVTRCLQPDPLARPTAADVIKVLRVEAAAQSGPPSGSASWQAVSGRLGRGQAKAARGAPEDSCTGLSDRPTAPLAAALQAQPPRKAGAGSVGATEGSGLSSPRSVARCSPNYGSVGSTATNATQLLHLTNTTLGDGGLQSLEDAEAGTVNGTAGGTADGTWAVKHDTWKTVWARTAVKASPFEMLRGVAAKATGAVAAATEAVTAAVVPSAGQRAVPALTGPVEAAPAAEVAVPAMGGPANQYGKAAGPAGLSEYV